MTSWLKVVGIGDDGWKGLPENHQRIVLAADVIVSGKRHAEFLPETINKELIFWRSPLSDTIDEITKHRDKIVVVLASGDPLDFGVATTLLRHFDADEVSVFPSPSSLSLACARMGWSRQEADCLSLHGRPSELLNAYIYPGAKLLVLSHNGETPNHVSDLLVGNGYGRSTVTVLSHLNGEREFETVSTAENWQGESFADLNLIALDCQTSDNPVVLGRTPGLPDEAFISDGQLTKRTIRVATLAKLRPIPGQLLWDVGAGSGSIAIEWMRHHPRCRAVAIEKHQKRLGYLAENIASLGTPGLKVVEGSAPDALGGLEAPDAVFVGGGIRNKTIVDACFNALKVGGRLVANAVTLEAEAVLLKYFEEKGGSLERIAVSAADPVGGLHGWRPSMPVTQYHLIKE